MLSDKETLRLYDIYGILNALKYVKSESGLDLKSCKEYIERLINRRANIDIDKGTITWFSVDKLPPIEYPELMGNPSEKVLVWGKGGFPIQTYYVHDANCWFSSNNIPFEITHWAFINLPE
jgi:hypothetical protein